MQVYSTMIDEIMQHIHFTLAGQVVRTFIYKMGFKDLFENRIYIDSQYTGASRSYDNVRLPILNEDVFRCKVKLNTDSMGLKWDSTNPGQHMDPTLHRRDNLNTIPIFYDPLHNIQLIQRYLPCNIIMQCTMVFVDHTVAFDSMSKMTALFNKGQLLNVQDLSYHYKMPIEILKRLYVLGDMIGIQKGTYLDWFKQHSNGMIDKIVSVRQNNRSSQIVINKQHFNALVSIDYQGGQPQIQTLGSAPNTASISFTMTLQFGRVNMLYLKYPLVVNNTLIPQKMVCLDPINMYGKIYRDLHHPYTSIDPGYQMNKMIVNQPARNPWYDDWDLPNYTGAAAYKAKPFFMGIVTLDNKYCKCTSCSVKQCPYKYTIIDLTKDMDDYPLQPYVLQWFRQNYNYVFNPQSKYSIAVYKDNQQLGKGCLKFDGQKLKIPNCLGGNHLYHMVLYSNDFEQHPCLIVRPSSPSIYTPDTMPASTVTTTKEVAIPRTSFGTAGFTTVTSTITSGGVTKIITESGTTVTTTTISPRDVRVNVPLTVMDSDLISFKNQEDE